MFKLVKITCVILGVFIFISCQTQENKPVDELVPISDEMLESAIIYEANIRQYSSEGSFNEFTKDIPQLKELGVKVIWLMPIFPISQTKRKATGGDFASLIEDETLRKKALGSYYAVSDYRTINPEFGTLEDFRELLKTAHNNGMYVILDWVPNHTGWDHSWISTNPEFYKKNSQGEITDPLNEDGTSKGWGDVAQLDMTNKSLQEKMINDMQYWVEKENVDGFRCDHVDPTPISFWKKAIPTLQKNKKLFMLAETGDPRFMKDSLFDMCYAWDTHFMMNDIVIGKKSVKDWDALMTKLNSDLDTNDYLMNFVTSHDENSWKGTVTERFGNASETMLALSYMTPGMPLIYSGQEYGLNHRLKFFEKDSIPKTKGKVWSDLEKLGKLKNNYVALNGGVTAANYKRIETGNQNILMFIRSKNDEKILFVSNFSDVEQELNSIPSGNYINYMSNREENYKELQSETLEPWEYKILVKK